MGYSLWYVKIDPSQNQDLSTSLERSYKELLNALISFEIRHCKLKLWEVKEKLQNDLFQLLDHTVFGTSRSTIKFDKYSPCVVCVVRECV